MARNNGITHAKGDYIWFIDSDDCISYNSISPILSYLYKTNVDFLRIEKTDVPEDFKPHTEETIELIEAKTWLGPATAFNFIIKREYLLKHSIFFEPDISYGEDTLWVFWIGFFKNKHVYLKNKIYKYRQRESSAMGNVNKMEHLCSMLRMADIYNDYYNQYNQEENKKQLLDRAREAAQNALFDAIMISYSHSKETLKHLIKSGIYPYPILWERVTTKYGFKNFIINSFSLLFPLKYYYLSVSRILNLIKR